MKVKFNLNLGSVDAKKLGLNAAECVSGAVVELREDLALALLARGIVEEPKAKAAKSETAKPEAPPK